jgi:hypothetical protein
MRRFKIIDWAGNDLTAHGTFTDWEDAEEYLSTFLGEAYDSDRGEYYIVEVVP